MVRLNTEKIDLDVIGEELERSKEITTTGVVFRGWRLEDLAPVLRTAVVFSERLPDTERHRIINLALFEAGRLGKLCRKSIITALGRLEAEYLSASPQTFVLATTVSADFSDLLRPVKVHGATVAFSRWLPERFDRSSLSSIPEWPETPDPFDFMSVRVSVKARTKFEAFDRASEALDFVRALWNYSITRGTLSRHSMGRPAPVNQARLGPVQTLHHPDGSLVDANLYWYQIDYHDSTTSLKRHEWARILREFSSLRRAIARVKYAPVLYDVFVRYARALDGSDFEAVFLKLWSILELLTDTVGGRYDQTIRRSLFTWSERDLNQIILENLRQYRNAVVHRGESVEHVEALTYQLKRYVESLLRFHLGRVGTFATLAEAGEFLELPFDGPVLRQRIRRYREALKYRGG